MNMQPLDYIRVSLLPNIGVNRGKALLRTFGSFEELVNAPEKRLSAVEGIHHTLAKQLHTALHNVRLLNDIERHIERTQTLCEKEGIRFVSIEDHDYPEPLRKIYDPPLYLFIRGTYSEADHRALAIVGTRQPTDYGRQATAHFASALAEAGITIVSGLATGIDTVAHHTALHQGTRTVAVLGSGVNVIYPPGNRNLAVDIAGQGCLLSEFLPNAKPDAMNFPRRNRVISGLTHGTLVIEAGMRSGATLTANFAFDQNKDVFAVPGNIFSSKSDGTNDLIKRNVAIPVTSVEDIFAALERLRPDSAPRKEQAIQLTITESLITESLSLDPLHIDALASATSLSISDLLIHLLQLEFKGVVRQLPGKYFVLSKI